MSSKLSAVAQLDVLRLLSGADDYVWFSHVYEKLPTAWKVLHGLYLSNTAEPPEGYLRSRELAMIQKNAISEDDLSFIFSHGQPLVFEACPAGLVPKLIETFQELREEPTFLHLTMRSLCGYIGRFEVSPPLYVDRFPCTACRQEATVQTRFRPNMACASEVECVVEKFHICSKHFSKQLSLELYYATGRHFNGYEFYERPETATDNAKSCSPIKVVVRVEDSAHGVSAVPSSKVASKRTTMMLVAEFAVEVFGFLDRIHVGSSLLANRQMHDCLSDAKGILPAHPLSCELGKEKLGYDYENGRERYSTYYRLTLHHFLRDLPYNDTRQFKLCDEMSPQEECAVALRHLSNSYIAGFGDDRDNYLGAGSHHAKLFLRMLGALAGRNVAVGRVKMDWFEACVRDYSALERAFVGQLPLKALRVCLEESKFVGLVKITDFFRYSVMQRLTELCLSLHDTRYQSSPQMGPLPNPLWVDGIQQLRNCEKYEVRHSGRRIRSAVRKRLVQICEKFERGEIPETVAHFAFFAHNDGEISFPFNADNLVASRVNVVAANRWAHVAQYQWDVYHFRNAEASKSLTAMVGHGLREFDGAVLHLLRGAVYPEALLTFRESH